MKQYMNDIEFCDRDGNGGFGIAEFVLSDDGSEVIELCVKDDNGDPVDMHDEEIDGICDHILQRLAMEQNEIPENQKLRAVVLASVSADGTGVMAQDKLLVNSAHIKTVSVQDITSAYACIAAAAYSACFASIERATGGLSPAESRAVEAAFWDAVEQSQLLKKESLNAAWKALENQRSKDPTVGYAGKVFRALHIAKNLCEDHDNAEAHMRALERAMADFNPDEFVGFEPTDD